MPDENANEPQPLDISREAGKGEREPSQRQRLTPELRRFLNKPRALPNEKADVPVEAEPAPAAPPPPAEPAPRAPRILTTRSAGRAERAAPTTATVLGDKKGSRTIELQQAFIILGAVLLLGLAFFVGTKFNYLKYLLASRKAPAADTGAGPDPYPAIAPADLVKQALASEREGKWEDAVERLMSAKRKDLRYRGILFRVGKILYDHRNFEPADKAFERAIVFGENLDGATFYRGLIAVRHRDLPAAERFFESAVTAAPFVADYHYYWGETLRLDFKPEPALPHYEQAILLASSEQDAIVCQFKIRMGRIEAAEGSAVADELKRKEAAGPLSVDWLMTAAALQVRAGQIEAAKQFVDRAREGKAPGLFASCVNDFYFSDAAKKYPELAEALRLDLDLQAPFPN